MCHGAGADVQPSLSTLFQKGVQTLVLEFMV